MVKVKRISPEDDVTLEIRASKLAWANIVGLLWNHSAEFVGESQHLIDALHREINGQ